MKAEAYLMPLTLCSGMIEGAQTWESYKALCRAMKTGRAADARAVGEAIVRDMNDPKKAGAFSEGMRQAEIGMRAADILRRDKGELGQMMKDAGAAYRAAKEAKQKHKQALSAWGAAHRQHMDAVGRLCAGADAGALAVIGETAKAIARYRQEAEKHAQEYMQKKEEADSLYQSAMNMAAAKAKREMLLEAEKKRARRSRKEAKETPRAAQETKEESGEETVKSAMENKPETKKQESVETDKGNMQGTEK